MIVGSLLLILVAVGLLVAGVLGSSNVLIIGSIVATVIAAIVLILGVRQSAKSADDEEDYDGLEPDEAGTSSGAAVTEDAASGSIPSQSRERHESATGTSGAAGGGDRFEAPPAQYAPNGSGAPVDEDPPDEPSAQVTSPSNAARIAMLTNEVLVIDGRPRYHVSGCVHLLGRQSEPLPVGEAVELGFSPCGMCEPDSALLAEARRV